MSSTRVRLGTTCGWGARNWRTLVTPKRHEQIRVHVTNGWGNRVYHWWPSYESYVLTGELLFSFDSCHGDFCTHSYFWCSCSGWKLWQSAKVVLRSSGSRCFCPICGCFLVVWMHGNRGMPKHQTPTSRAPVRPSNLRRSQRPSVRTLILFLQIWNKAWGVGIGTWVGESANWTPRTVAFGPLRCDCNTARESS